MMSRRRRSPLGCQETVQPHAKAAGFNITLIRAIRSDGKLSLIKLILAGGDDHRGGFNSIHLPSHPSGTRPTPHPQRLNVTTIRRIDRFNETFQVLKWTNRVRPRNLAAVSHTSFLLRRLDGSVVAFVVVGQRNNTAKMSLWRRLNATTKRLKEKTKVLRAHERVFQAKNPRSSLHRPKTTRLSFLTSAIQSGRDPTSPGGSRAAKIDPHYGQRPHPKCKFVC